MIKKNSKLILGIIIGLIISIGGVYATNELTARDVRIDKTNGKLANIPGNTVEDALDYLHTQASKIGTCPEGWYCVMPLDNPITASDLQVGDLIKMTPTLASFTTDTNMTGYRETQTIYPQELNLWRVIRKNDDGTIDVVSEYVSSTAVSFSGVKGYKNYIAYLNTLASKYENSNYTVGSRHMGYDSTKATATLTSTTKYSSGSSAPWTETTSSSTTAANEKIGAGDMGYVTDYSLVKAAYKGTTTYGSNSLGTVRAYKVGTTTATNYSLASRQYRYSNDIDFRFCARFIYFSGHINDQLNDGGIIRRHGSTWIDDASDLSLRPILTLKSTVTSSKMEVNTGAYVLD